MTRIAAMKPLDEQPGSVGLFDDLHNLQSGNIRLQLDGYKFDTERDLPFYLFNIVTAEGETAGQYHFTPGLSAVVGDIGNSGGHVDPAFRNRGFSKDVIKALGALAVRHGMDSFLITCERENVAARAVLAKLGSESNDGDLFRYQIPASA